MTRRTKGWLAAAVLFGLGNVAGVVMAAIAKEPMHAATHVVLAALSALAAWALVVRASEATRQEPSALATPIGGVSSRLSHLELSLQALSAGVERMSEGERAITQLFVERHGDVERRDGGES